MHSHDKITILHNEDDSHLENFRKNSETAIERKRTVNSYAELDLAIQDYLSGEENHWLMSQALLNAQTRRQILESLPVAPNTKILDIGTGFGAVSFDLASQMQVEIEAIDVDQEHLQKAESLQDHLREKVNFPGTIHFQNADIYELPYENDSFDFAIAWFVFQHLNDSERAIREIQRVLRPGGYVCLIDIDDQYVITYPEPSEPVKKMRQAIESLQQSYGGDRFIGRKLPDYLDKQGLNVVAAVIQPQSSFVSSENDIGRKLEMELCLQLKADLLENDILTEAQFEKYMKAFEEEPAGTRFESNAQFIVLAQK